MAPLDGLRVIDLTRVVAGPFCTMMLGDMGAEVLKIEEPEHGDDSRGWAPFIAGTGSFYLALNRSKKSVALDLKAPEGAAALRRLIETADVLIESFRPGSLAELGFDYDAMSALNPRLIYCSISGYGQTGPAAELPGYDAVIQGEAGIMDMTGFPDGAPTRVGVAITDYLAGLYAIQGILLALTDRQKSGLGQRVDIALIETVFRGLTLQELTRRFEAKNVPCGRVRSISEALEHPQVAAREVLMVQQHPQVGNVETLAPVIRLSRTPAEVRLPPPALGEHTAEVLAAVADRHR